MLKTGTDKMPYHVLEENPRKQRKSVTAVTHRLGRKYRNFGHLLLCSIYGAKNDFQENMT